MSNTNKFRFAVRKFEPFERSMQKIWESFCVATGCKLEAEFIAMDLPELHHELITNEGLKNGNWDAAHLVTDWLLEAYTANAIADIKPALNKQELAAWSNSLLDIQQFDGKLLGLPFHDGPECLIYRKDLFESPQEQQKFKDLYGKDLKVPLSWDDFIEIAEFFQRPEDNLYGTVVAAFPDGHNTVFDFCLQLWSRGGELLDADGNIQINTPEAADGLIFYRDLLNNHQAIHPQSAQYESVQAGEAFARGEVAMMVNWFGFAAVCEVSESSKVKGKVDVAGLPKAGNGEACSLNVYWMYAVGTGSKHQDIALAFVKYATQAQQDKLLTLEGGIGCRKSTWQDADVNRIIPYYHKLEELHKHAKTLPQSKHWSAIANLIDELVVKACSTTSDVKVLLEDTQHKINTINIL